MSCWLQLEKKRNARWLSVILAALRFGLWCSCRASTALDARLGGLGLGCALGNGSKKVLLGLEDHGLRVGLRHPREGVELGQAAHMHGRVVSVNERRARELFRPVQSQQALLVVYLVHQHLLLL